MFKITKDNVSVYNMKNGEYLGTIQKGDEIEIMEKWPFRTPTGRGIAARISDDEYIILELNGETVAEEKKENKKGKKKNE